MNNISVRLEQKDDRTSIIRIYVNGLSPIAADGRIKYQRLRINAGMIPKAQWDANLNRPTTSFSRRDGGALHRVVDFTVLNLQRAYVESPEKTYALVRERFEELMGRRRTVAKKSTYLRDIVQGWIRTGGKTQATITTYRVFAHKLADYEASHGKRIDMGKVTVEELEQFIAECKHRYMLGNNAAWNLQKSVNKAITQVRKDGVNLESLSTYRFITPTKEVLDWADIARLTAYVPRNSSEAAYQTISVAIVLSSVRISDVWQYLRSIERRNGILCAQFVVTKHPHPTVSPIVYEPIRALIEKNGMPEFRTEQLIRRGVRKLLRTIGIEKEVQVHSLRRSFVTNFLSIGLFPDHLLAKVHTGHALGGGGRNVFHGYDQANLAQAQRTLVELLRMVDKKRTGGLELLSDEVVAP